jgi:hypothetical protein
MNEIVNSYGTCRGWYLTAGVALFFVMATSAPLRSQPVQDARQITAVVTAGISRPADPAFRELYGSVVYPLSAQGEFELHRNIQAFGAFGHLRRTGRTQTDNSASTSANDAIKFRMNSIKVGFLYALPLRRITLLCGGGAGFHFYEETWEEAAATTSGRRTGFVLQGGAEFALTRRFALVGRLEYTRINIRAETAMENDAGLGGLEMSLGIALRLNRLRHP